TNLLTHLLGAVILGDQLIDVRAEQQQTSGGEQQRDEGQRGTPGAGDKRQQVYQHHQQRDDQQQPTDVLAAAGHLGDQGRDDDAGQTIDQSDEFLVVYHHLLVLHLGIGGG